MLKRIRTHGWSGSTTSDTPGWLHRPSPFLLFEKVEHRPKSSWILFQGFVDHSSQQKGSLLVTHLLELSFCTPGNFISLQLEIHAGLETLLFKLQGTPVPWLPLPQQGLNLHSRMVCKSSVFSLFTCSIVMLLAFPSTKKQTDAYSQAGREGE